MNKTYLTKSLFRIALDCPTKLYYSANEEYNSQSVDDAFLKSLAEGGFQVGALARCYYPDGINVDEKSNDVALRKTAELLQRDDVTIFEAAVKYGNLLVRVDILVKKENLIQLIEVKTKSYDVSDDAEFLNKKGTGVTSAWKPYLYDVAFQQYVLEKAFPGKVIKPYLMLADKNATASVDGLNQKFQLIKLANGQTRVQIAGDCDFEALGDEILIRVPAGTATGMIFEAFFKKETDKGSFAEWVDFVLMEYLLWYWASLFGFY